MSYFDIIDGLIDDIESNHCTCGAYEKYLLDDEDPPTTWEMCGIHTRLRELERVHNLEIAELRLARTDREGK